MESTSETRHDRQQRLQQRNDRNALLTGVFGLAVVVFGFAVAITSTGFDGEMRPTGGLVIAALGAIAFVAGFYFRGRKIR